MRQKEIEGEREEEVRERRREGVRERRRGDEKEAHACRRGHRAYSSYSIGL